MRIFGLSGSGMDIDKIVGDLMKVERERRVSKLERKRQIDLWRSEMYQSINKDIANFIVEARKEFGLSKLTDTGTLLSGSMDSFTWVKTALSSDDTKVDAKATAKALNGSYNLNITQLAKNVSKTSTDSISVEGKTSKDTLDEQFAGISSGKILSFKIRTNVTENDSENYPNGYKEFSFDTSVNTLEDVIDEINNSNIGIQAAYDSDIDRFFLNTTETGEENYFNISNADLDGIDPADIITPDKFFADALKLDVNIDEDYGGKDAKFDFGDATGLTKSSNTFSINGINITAKNTGQTTITVGTDVDSVYEKITNFVDKYNELISGINEKLGEEVHRDYQPLTDEEKESLTEEQVKKWEGMAKSGLIKNDRILSTMLMSVREGLYKSVSGLSDSMNHLTQIGIETGEYSSKGKLEVDETKLKKAILNNPNGVIDLLFNSPDDYIDDEDKYNKSGLITRMFDTMAEDMKEIIDKAGPGEDSDLLRDVKSSILIDFVAGKNLKNGSISMLDENILDLEREILTQEKVLLRIENRYYSKYGAMEQALGQMYQQSSWLSSQLGSLM